MALHRYILKPLSPWGTPLRSDTMAGLLLYRLAEDEGEKALRDELDAFQAGEAPFVLSSAMPRDMVFAPKLPPLPRRAFENSVRRGDFVQSNGAKLGMLDALSLFKKFRKQRFLPLTVWNRHQKALSTRNLFAEYCRNPKFWAAPQIVRAQEMHVTINRSSNTALEGGLFTGMNYWPGSEVSFHVYAKTADSARLLARLKRLGMLGYGRDSSSGRGVFAVEEDVSFVQTEGHDVQGMDWSHGLLVSMLSARNLQGLKGYYAVEVKTGKAGPGFAQGNPYKSPFLCVQEGAVLKNLPQGPHVLQGLHVNPALLQITCPLTLPCNVREEIDDA